MPRQNVTISPDYIGQLLLAGKIAFQANGLQLT